MKLRTAFVSAALVGLVGVSAAGWWGSRHTTSSGLRLSLRSTSATVRTLPEDLTSRIDAMTLRLDEQPEDIVAAVMLSDALLRQARVTNRASLAMRAEAALTRVLREDAGNYAATQMMGAVYLSQHRFREAVAAAERARSMRPDDAVNFGIIGDGHLELGDYDRAFDAFDRMVQMKPGAAAYARVAYARELQGNVTGALEAMRLAVDATSAADREAVAWHRSQVGELLLQLGRVDEARREFALASEAFPGHPFAVAGAALVLEASGDLNGAVTLLGDLARRAPSPDVFARIGHLLERLGKDEEAEEAFDLAEVAWRSDAPEPKNLARLLADRGRNVDEAVRIAERASSDRDDIFTNDALAWAYYRAGRIDEARQAMSRALRTGSRDRDIRAHAAILQVKAE